MELADVWVGDWSATYDTEGLINTQGEDTIEEDDEEFKTTSNIVENLIEGINGVIGQNLTQHSIPLKEAAVAKIMELNEEYFNSPVIVTDYKMKIHLEGTQKCTTCVDKIKEVYEVDNLSELEIEDIIEDIKEVLRGTFQGTDDKKTKLRQVYNCIYNKVEQETRRADAIKREEFRNQLNNKITYNQWATAEKANVDIVVDVAHTRTTSTYEKNKEKRGGKPSKFVSILGSYDNANIRQDLLTDWFWENIRNADDTARLEDVLRILFNETYSTNQFGTYSDYDIQSMFNRFLPKEIRKREAGHFEAFYEWLKSYENSILRDYMNGDMMYGPSSTYVTHDKQKGKIYYSSSKQRWEIWYGIPIASYEALFGEYGHSVSELIKKAEQGQEVTIPVEHLEQIFRKIVMDKYSTVKTLVETHGVTMETWQYLALTNFSYQYGNCGEALGGQDNVAEIYKKYYIVRNRPEEFKNRAVCQYAGKRINYFNHIYNARQSAAWILFTQGRYILNTSEEIEVSSSGEYPEGIRIISLNGYNFPEYPQYKQVGIQYVLYKDKPYGKVDGKTLETSGCGAFTTACIVSGLLGDPSINPLTVVDDFNEYFPNGEYYQDGVGTTNAIYNRGFWKKYYGLNLQDCEHLSINSVLEIFEKRNGNCAAFGNNQAGHIIAVIPIIGDSEGYRFQIIDSALGYTGKYKSADDFYSRTGKRLGIKMLVYP